MSEGHSYASILRMQHMIYEEFGACWGREKLSSGVGVELARSKMSWWIELDRHYLYPWISLRRALNGRGLDSAGLQVESWRSVRHSETSTNPVISF